MVASGVESSSSMFAGISEFFQSFSRAFVRCGSGNQTPTQTPSISSGEEHLTTPPIQTSIPSSFVIIPSGEEPGFNAADTGKELLADEAEGVQPQLVVAVSDAIRTTPPVSDTLDSNAIEQDTSATAQIVLYSFIGLLAVLLVGAFVMYLRLRTIRKKLKAKKALSIREKCDESSGPRSPYSRPRAASQNSVEDTLVSASESRPFFVVKDFAYNDGAMPDYDSTTDESESEDERDFDSESDSSDSDSDSESDDEVCVAADERV